MFLPIFCFFSFIFSQTYTAKCDFDSNGKIVITNTTGQEDKTGYAWATWDDGINETGWYQFHVEGNESLTEDDDSRMMFCAGALEGYLSHNSIYDHFMLICDMQSFNRQADIRYGDGWENYLTKSIEFVENSIEAYQDSSYWQTVGLVFSQFKGLVEGYNMRENEIVAQNGQSRPMTIIDHWVLQSQGDIGDVSHAVPKYKTAAQGGPTADSTIRTENTLNKMRKRLQKGYQENDCAPETLGDHCTGVIKLTKDYSDLYLSHDAWSQYIDLHGELKEYHLPCKKFHAKTIEMSTRVGKLSSYDDFYLADSGLLVIETTMSVFNESLYDYIHPETLFTWMRAVHALWTARNGSEWTDTFIKHNSGTYNNQYLVIDSNKFERFQKPTTDFLWVVEQYPGPFWKRADITERLVNDLYFPSFNKPSFKELYDVAGYPQKVEMSGPTGNFYTYESSARYLLIAREAPRLDDFELFKQFMRYNNWKRDLYSNGDASQQIMSRYDQRRYGDPYGLPKAFGGLDSKCLKLTEAVTRMNFHAIASPSHEDNPIWSFDSEIGQGIKHDGLPTEWNFSWLEFKSNVIDVCAKITEKDDCLNAKWCGWCGSEKKCLPGEKDAPFFNEKCSSGWKFDDKLASWVIPLVSVFGAIIVIGIVAGLVIFFMQKKKSQNGFETLN